MKKELKILKIGLIHFNKSFYPRKFYSHATSNRYATSMNNGDTFPPIIVANIEDKYFLIDGKHRLEAHNLNGKKHIQTEILYGLKKEDAYLESVKRNKKHGKPFSDADHSNIIRKLNEMNYDIDKICKTINVKKERVESLLVNSREFKRDFSVGIPEPSITKEERLEIRNTERDGQTKKLNAFMIYEKRKGSSKYFIFSQSNLGTIKKIISNNYYILPVKTKESNEEDILNGESPLIRKEFKEIRKKYPFISDEDVMERVKISLK